MSELARQLIEENLKIKNPVLDLGNCGLDGTEDEFYRPLADADHVKTLVLSNEWHEYDNEKEKWEWKRSQHRGPKNSFSQIPGSLPKKLKFLVLDEGWPNKWVIQDYSSLKELIQLQSLNLRNNQIHDISFLRNLKQLQSLELSNLHLKDSQLNDHLEEWQFHYNWFRAHSSLQGKTPRDIVSEKSSITPFWDDVIDKYDPDQEPILEQNYQRARKLGQIKGKKKKIKSVSSKPLIIPRI